MNTPKAESRGRVRFLSQTSQKTLNQTKFARGLSKRSADSYIQETVRFTQRSILWPDVATAQLSGQLDRVLSKVVQYYGPEGGRYGKKKKRIADLMVGMEISKLFDLIHVSPESTKREDAGRSKTKAIPHEDQGSPTSRLPNLHRFRLPRRLPEIT